ncbi:MAG: hypothetical protein AAF957_27955 [Planctomycetota bacterium]
MTCPKDSSPRRVLSPSPTRGAALFALVPVAMLMLSLMIAFVGTTIDSSRAGTSKLDSFRARAAAQSTASLVVADLWGAFEAISTGDEQIWTFRAWLDGLGLADQGGVANPAKMNYLPTLALATDMDGDEMMDGVEIERVDVYRIDEWDSTSLVVEVVAVMQVGDDGSSRSRRSSVREVFSVAPPEWDGLDFALLASNVNCLLCHTDIDNVQRIYNQNQINYGSYDEVRVGSIDSIHFRSDPDSSIAGIALIGGDAIQGNGENITDWSQFNLNSVGRTDGKLDENMFGDLTTEALNIFDHVNPDPTANLFLDYFSYGKDAAFGQELPSRFPTPFTDNGGFDFALQAPRPDLAANRIIDDTEFDATVYGMNGSMSGGAISVMAKGTQINDSSTLASMMSGNATSITGVTDANVYLRGTVANPIILDGDVAIDGDVIISGVVKGQGTLRARGNVYVTGDLVYDDAGGASSPTRTYGYAADGTENNLAIAAGGNIVMGDFYRPAWGSGTVTDGTKATSYNFTMEELGIFNRQEWFKTQPTLPGKTKKVKTGTKTVYSDEKVKETYYVQEPVYANKPYTVVEPVYSWVPTGNKIKKTAYKKVTKTNGLPAPYTETWQETVFSHHYYVDEKKKVQTGTQNVTKYNKVQTGTKTVAKTKWVVTGDKIASVEDVYGWVTPQHPNPYFVAGHTPRYYAFSEGQELPIFNKDGYFDPATDHWMSDEIVEDWDNSKLSYADPTDSGDPYLYNPDGTPKAVISTVTPTNDWIDGDEMRTLIQDHMANDQEGTKTFEVDATLYSGNSVLGTMPGRNSSATDGTLRVNGGLVASDVGILAPIGTDVNYDVRGAIALSITADVGLEIKRRYSAPAVEY